MSIGDQAEKALRSAQQRAAKAKLLASFETFRFRAYHVERRAEEPDWTSRAHAIGPNGEIVRGLYLTFKTPSPLDFGISYDWFMVSVCPYWVEYHGGGHSVRFNGNQSRPKRRT